MISIDPAERKLHIRFDHRGDYGVSEPDGIVIVYSDTSLHVGLCDGSDIGSPAILGDGDGQFAGGEHCDDFLMQRRVPVIPGDAPVFVAIWG